MDHYILKTEYGTDILTPLGPFLHLLGFYWISIVIRVKEFSALELYVKNLITVKKYFKGEKIEDNDLKDFFTDGGTSGGAGGVEDEPRKLIPNPLIFTKDAVNHIDQILPRISQSTFLILISGLFWDSWRMGKKDELKFILEKCPTHKLCKNKLLISTIEEYRNYQLLETLCPPKVPLAGDDEAFLKDLITDLKLKKDEEILTFIRNTYNIK